MQFAIAQRITCPQVLIQKHLIRLLSGRVFSELLLLCCYYMSFSIAFLAVYFIRKHTALILNTDKNNKEKQNIVAPVIPAILF